MISIYIKTGNADSEAPSVSDGLIITQGMAVIRGRQELATYGRIVKGRRVRRPHAPSSEIGDRDAMTVQRLGISGEHDISELTIELGPKGAYDIVNIEQYGDFQV